MTRFLSARTLYAPLSRTIDLIRRFEHWTVPTVFTLIGAAIVPGTPGQLPTT